jgi:gliding motility-associated-like protein
MRKVLIIALLGLIIGFFPGRVQASHVAGMDLTLTCLGGNDYLIRLAFYRDCSGISAPTTAAFVVQCTSNPIYNFNITGVPLKAGSGVEVTPICPTWVTRCSGGTLYGLQEYVFEIQVTLPPCNHWKIGWSGSTANLNGLCCRNPNNTVVNPGSQNAYIEVTLNNQTAPCASTPSFSQPPLAALCVGQTQCVNMGALDPNGDSLSYSLVTPMTNGNGGMLTWVFPYTATQPFPSLPPITLDPVTGNLCMSPTQNIVSPMAIRVQKWRTIPPSTSPTLIGTLYRDIQINAATCNNQVPSLSGMDTTMTKGYDPNDTIFIKEVCLGHTVQFAMWGYDPDNPNPTWGNLDKFSISWNSGIPQGSFQTFYNNTDSAYATFSWTPGPADVSNTPRCFTATIRDGACPYNGVQSYGYCVIVRGMFVNIGNDTLLCKGESVTLHATTDTTTVNHIWFLNGIPTGTPLSSTSYTLNTTNLPAGQHIISIQTNDGGTTMLCPGVDQAIITVVDLPKPNLGNDTTLCEPHTVTLNAGPGNLYLWSHGAISQTTTISQTGMYHVLVDGGNGTRCTGQDSIYVEVVKMPLVDLGADTCSSVGVPISSGVDQAHYIWNTGATTKEITPSQSGVYSVTVTYKPGSGCDASDTKVFNIINVNLGPDTTICTHETLTLVAPQAPAGHSYSYFWSPDGQTTQTIVVSDKDEGEYFITVDAGGGCTGEVKVTVIPCPITIPNVFTPNNDGRNDYFEIDGIDNYPGSKLLIYNRWGQRVFESDNYNSSIYWDARGHSDGVYFYVLYLKNRVKGEMEFKEYSGSVTVLRSR